MNRATEAFRGYVLAKGMANDPFEAVSYSKEMAFGAIRFAAESNSDAGV